MNNLSPEGPVTGLVNASILLAPVLYWQSHVLLFISWQDLNHQNKHTAEEVQPSDHEGLLRWPFYCHIHVTNISV